MWGITWRIFIFKYKLYLYLDFREWCLNNYNSIDNYKYLNKIPQEFHIDKVNYFKRKNTTKWRRHMTKQREHIGEQNQIKLRNLLVFTLFIFIQRCLLWNVWFAPGFSVGSVLLTFLVFCVLCFLFCFSSLCFPYPVLPVSLFALLNNNLY